jgi:hypothetical protein
MRLGKSGFVVCLCKFLDIDRGVDFGRGAVLALAAQNEDEPHGVPREHADSGGYRVPHD